MSVLVPKGSIKGQKMRKLSDTAKFTLHALLENPLLIRQRYSFLLTRYRVQTYFEFIAITNGLF